MWWVEVVDCGLYLRNAIRMRCDIIKNGLTLTNYRNIFKKLFYLIWALLLMRVFLQKVDALENSEWE